MDVCERTHPPDLFEGEISVFCKPFNCSIFIMVSIETMTVQISAKVSGFTSKVLLLSPSLATPNYRSSIATIKSCKIRITTWFINSLASSPLDK